MSNVCSDPASLDGRLRSKPVGDNSVKLDVPHCNKTVVNSNCSETLCEGKRVVGETRRRRGLY